MYHIERVHRTLSNSHSRSVPFSCSLSPCPGLLRTTGHHRQALISQLSNLFSTWDFGNYGQLQSSHQIARIFFLFLKIQRTFDFSKHKLADCDGSYLPLLLFSSKHNTGTNCCALPSSPPPICMCLCLRVSLVVVVSTR